MDQACNCEGTTYANKFGYVGVSGTPGTGKCGGECASAGKPFDVREDEPVVFYQVGGAGSVVAGNGRVKTPPLDVAPAPANMDIILEHLYGLVEDVERLRGEVSALRVALGNGNVKSGDWELNS